MSADLAAIAAHAEVLRADAQALTACAERLREIEAGLAASGIAPSWLRASVNAHRTACLQAADRPEHGSSPPPPLQQRDDPPLTPAQHHRFRGCAGGEIRLPGERLGLCGVRSGCLVDGARGADA